MTISQSNSPIQVNLSEQTKFNPIQSASPSGRTAASAKGEKHVYTNSIIDAQEFANFLQDYLQNSENLRQLDKEGDVILKDCEQDLNLWDDDSKLLN